MFAGILGNCGSEYNMDRKNIVAAWCADLIDDLCMRGIDSDEHIYSFSTIPAYVEQIPVGKEISADEIKNVDYELLMYYLLPKVKDTIEACYIDFRKQEDKQP
jgi:hypothetical protein